MIVQIPVGILNHPNDNYSKIIYHNIDKYRWSRLARLHISMYSFVKLSITSDPKSVTLLGSPPKWIIFCDIHLMASIWSCSPRFVRWMFSVSNKLNPSAPSLYCMVTTITPPGYRTFVLRSFIILWNIKMNLLQIILMETQRKLIHN